MCLPPCMSATAAPTQEELDAQRCTELEGKVADVTKLLSERLTRERADALMQTAEAHFDSVASEPPPLLTVFHDHEGTRVPTTRRTQASMKLFAAMKARERVYSHPRDLEHALNVYTNELRQLAGRRWQRLDAKRAARRKAG